MAFNGIIARKFALLDEYQTQLRKELDGVTFAYFRRNWALRCATERALQVMAEIVVDLDDFTKFRNEIDACA